MSLKSASSINVVWHDWTIVKCSFLIRGTAPLLTMQTGIWRGKKRGKKGKHLGKIVGGCAVLQNGYAIFERMRNFLTWMHRFNRSLDLENFSGLWNHWNSSLASYKEKSPQGHIKIKLFTYPYHIPYNSQSCQWHHSCGLKYIKGPLPWRPLLCFKLCCYGTTL